MAFSGHGCMYNADSGPREFFFFFLSFLFLKFLITIFYTPASGCIWHNTFSSRFWSPEPDTFVRNYRLQYSACTHEYIRSSILTLFLSLSRLDHEIHFYLLITTKITTTKILYQHCWIYNVIVLLLLFCLLLLSLCRGSGGFFLGFVHLFSSTIYIYICSLATANSNFLCHLVFVLLLSCHRALLVPAHFMQRDTQQILIISWPSELHNDTH